jgi:FAD/FMN-containing dehydrogenase/Fe-S oxidoreductase
MSHPFYKVLRKPVVLPKLLHEHTLEPLYQRFVEALPLAGFEGDIDCSYAGRLVHAVDNSVYQFIPQAVLYPKHQQDLVCMLKCAQTERFHRITFAARGGGTGTNGQSLNFGLIVDTSKYFNQILEVNPEERWVRVQAGVVKDALNDYLRPHGLFFSPDTSTSNRATIGGMIHTDAAGSGSLVYGKTSEHLEALTHVLADGTVLQTQQVSIKALESLYQNEMYSKVTQVVKLCRQHRARIEATFPKLNRFMTGYDLKHVLSDDLTSCDISRLFAGSEGTLGILVEAKLRLDPIPSRRVLVTLSYASLESALRHARVLMATQPTAIELMDEKIVKLAQSDVVWHQVKDLIVESPKHPLVALNTVEYQGDASLLALRIQSLKKQLNAAHDGVIGYHVCAQPATIDAIYQMRKKAVGLLAKTQGSRKPIAFVEDVAVPPQQLPEFAMKFKALLDNALLDYGMFGHIDAGVLHVRPALDLCDVRDEHKLREISDKVCDLTLKYKGVMWGEHGKGVRGEYMPSFFGETLYQVLRQIKQIFDPNNQLNPGKLVTPSGSQADLISIDATKRGHFDRQITGTMKSEFAEAMACNGNGLCFNYQPNSLMCPSYQVTQDRIQSPKGRATLLREWMRLVTKKGISLSRLPSHPSVLWLFKLKYGLFDFKKTDFSHEVHAALAGCLSCKACASQCPVQVNIPDLKAKFYQYYYLRYFRPWRDYLLLSHEFMLPTIGNWPRLTNLLTHNPLSRLIFKYGFGWMDLPKLSAPSAQRRLRDEPVWAWDAAQLGSLSPRNLKQYVVVVQDPYTTYYDALLVSALVTLLQLGGFQVIVLPCRVHGKAMHVKGFLKQFERVAHQQAQILQQFQQLKITMVGLDPAMVLALRQEYQTLPNMPTFKVLLLQEWLAANLSAYSPLLQQRLHPQTVHLTLLQHCTEASALPESKDLWHQIFTHFGLDVTIPAIGCCGMAGSFGHEKQNQTVSKQLFTLTWQPWIQQPEHQVLATGFSCRSQTKRLSSHTVQHPLLRLLEQLNPTKVEAK